ncbi:uncharacterized protein TNCV_2566761 [Trichonephila clavipes]|uniref:Uncharacterized protein n=1 Tax=Trichonephila clavipes TaxID=2585209 RepID=A0A8X6WKK2_TRICX|nr:uncharacterized protein TNCV_2566761 [Trichonephila clavipes]
MNLTWRNPPAHHWYSGKSPGLSLQCRSSRGHQTALTRFRSGYLRSMNFVQGIRDRVNIIVFERRKYVPRGTVTGTLSERVSFTNKNDGLLRRERKSIAPLTGVQSFGTGALPHMKDAGSKITPF